MSQIIQNNRNGCLLHGALKVLKAIEGFVPIIHSNAGCGIYEQLASNSLNVGYHIPSANIIEKQIIFGGTSRLREQIKNTIKVIDGELYVVISGCSTEIVGDDIPAMTKEAQEQGYPVIDISTPGFKSSVYRGYEIAVNGIINQLPKLSNQEQLIEENLVNILGILPDLDPHWEGNFNEIERIINLVGIKSNKLFGNGSGIKYWNRIQNAKVNLVFSSWGLKIAENLKEIYNTPYIYFEELPVGAEDIENLLNRLASELNLDDTKIKEIIKLESKKLYNSFSKVSYLYSKYDFQKEISVVGDWYVVSNLTKFLSRNYGQIIKSIIITDNPEEETRETIIEKVKSFSTGEKTEVYFTEDGEKIKNILLESNPELILGSELENDVAEKLNIPLLLISSPIIDKVILGKSYIGIDGAINFLEDYSNEIINYALKTSNNI